MIGIVKIENYIYQLIEYDRFLSTFKIESDKKFKNSFEARIKEFKPEDEYILFDCRVVFTTKNLIEISFDCMNYSTKGPIFNDKDLTYIESLKSVKKFSL